MIKKLALFLTYLFHPLLMTTAGMLFILFSGTYLSYIPLSAKKMVISLVAIGTMLLPAIMVPLFKLKGMISDVHIDNQKERVTPLGITLIFFILTFTLFFRLPIFRFIQSFILGSTLSVFAAFALNFRWKISAHSIGLGGITALVIGFSYYVKMDFSISILLLIFISGIIGSSRVYLNAHRQFEIYLGWVMGFLIMLTCLMTY